MNALPPLPEQDPAVRWPTTEWSAGPLPSQANASKIKALYDHAFADPTRADIGATHALLIVHRGRIVAERYAAGVGPADTQPSWSMAKSITHALVGLLVTEGKLDIHAPAEVPEWSGAGDPRGAITLDQLLRMSSGLKFLEEYVPGEASDVIEMLFGKGKDDVAGFAASFPLAHPPGTFFAYSSGATNIVSRCAAAQTQDFESFMHKQLFAPLGMKSPKPRFDAAGTFIGSSFCFATPRDFARFGLLYVRGGVWEGRQLLPRTWIDYARTPTYQQAGGEADGPYGAHWWLDMAGPGTFSANGYDGQYILCCPDRDLVIVRSGATPLDLKDNLKVWMAELAACFAP